MGIDIVAKPQETIFTQRLQGLGEQISHLENQLQELDALKLVDAAPYWQNGLYLYLIFHGKGKRHKTYVGNNPARVADALANIERGQQVKQQIRKIRERLKLFKSLQARAQRHFTQAVNILADANDCEVNHG